MTRRKVQDVLDWCDHEVDHPSQWWAGLCLKMSRTAWGMPVVATSARLWWAKVPQGRRHHDYPKDVPAGAMLYAPLGTFGHAWIAGRDGIGFSIDYRRRGRVDRAAMNLPNWTHDSRVWWTDHDVSTGKRLPLYKDPYNAAKWPNRA